VVVVDVVDSPGPFVDWPGVLVVGAPGAVVSDPPEAVEVVLVVEPPLVVLVVEPPVVVLVVAETEPHVWLVMVL